MLVCSHWSKCQAFHGCCDLKLFGGKPSRNTCLDLCRDPRRNMVETVPPQPDPVVVAETRRIEEALAAGHSPEQIRGAGHGCGCSPPT